MIRKRIHHIPLINLPDDMILYILQHLSLGELHQFCLTNHMFHEDFFNRGLAMILATNAIASPFIDNHIMSNVTQRKYEYVFIIYTKVSLLFD